MTQQNKVLINIYKMKIHKLTEEEKEILSELLNEEIKICIEYKFTNHKKRLIKILNKLNK